MDTSVVLVLALFCVACCVGTANAADAPAAPPDGNAVQQFLQSSLEYTKGLGPAGPAVFIAIYIVASVLLIPASILTLGAGAIYGPFLGLAIVSAASTLGCTAAFLVSRYIARPYAQEKLLNTSRFQKIDQGISEQGAYLVFLLRLSPLVPFGLLNYSIGLTGIELGPYVAASWAGMLPGTFLYVYLGSVGSQTLNAASGGISPGQLALYGVGAIASFAAVREISKVATKSLGDWDEPPSGESLD